MFEAFRATFPYRSAAQKVAIVGACVVTVAGLAAVAVAAFPSEGGPGDSPPVKRADHQVFAVVMHSFSDRNQRPLLDRRLYGLATQAMHEHAQLTVYMGDDAPEVHQRLLTSRVLTVPVDNPNFPLPVEERDAIRADVDRALKDVPPSAATSVVGALRLLSSLVDSAQRSKAKSVVGWLIGDSISTVKDCNFYVLDMSPAATDETARACLGDAPIDLHGTEIRLVGIGQDLSDQTDSTVSVGATAVVSRMIELSNGKPVNAYLEGGPTGVGSRP